MRNISESLTTINIKDLLSDKEINDLIKYSQFKFCKEKNYILEKNELCYKLISLVIEKFKEMKENSLVKCLLIDYYSFQPLNLNHPHLLNHRNLVMFLVF